MVPTGFPTLSHLLCQTGLLTSPKHITQLSVPEPFIPLLSEPGQSSLSLSTFLTPVFRATLRDPIPPWLPTELPLAVSYIYEKEKDSRPELSLKFTDCNDHGQAHTVGSLPGTLPKKLEDSWWFPESNAKIVSNLWEKRKRKVPGVVRILEW